MTRGAASCNVARTPHAAADQSSISLCCINMLQAQQSHAVAWCTIAVSTPLGRGPADLQQVCVGVCACVFIECLRVRLHVGVPTAVVLPPGGIPAERLAVSFVPCWRCQC